MIQGKVKNISVVYLGFYNSRIHSFYLNHIWLQTTGILPWAFSEYQLCME